MTTHIPAHNLLDGDDPLAAALCKEAPHLFDGSSLFKGDWRTSDAERWKIAKRMCRACPVIAECAAIRDIHLARGTRIEGVWAGHVVGARGIDKASGLFQCGHPISPANTYRQGKKTRCATCNREAQRARYRSRKGAGDA